MLIISPTIKLQATDSFTRAITSSIWAFDSSAEHKQVAITPQVLIYALVSYLLVNIIPSMLTRWGQRYRPDY